MTYLRRILILLVLSPLLSAADDAAINKALNTLERASFQLLGEAVYQAASLRRAYEKQLDEVIEDAEEVELDAIHAAVANERTAIYEQDALAALFLQASVAWRKDEDLPLEKRPDSDLFGGTSKPAAIVEAESEYEEDVIKVFYESIDDCQKIRKKCIRMFEKGKKRAERRDQTAIASALGAAIDKVMQQAYLLELAEKRIRRYRMDNKLPVDGKITHLFVAFDDDADAEKHLVRYSSTSPALTVVNSPLGDGKCLNLAIDKRLDSYAAVSVRVNMPRGSDFKVGPNSYISFELLKSSAHPEIHHLIDIDNLNYRQPAKRIHGYLRASQADWKNNEWFTVTTQVSGVRMRAYSNSAITDRLPEDGFRVTRFEFHSDIEHSANIQFMLMRHLHVYELVDDDKDNVNTNRP